MYRHNEIVETGHAPSLQITAEKYNNHVMDNVMISSKTKFCTFFFVYLRPKNNILKNERKNI